MRLRDRVDAGRQLAARLAPWRSRAPAVIALPRGGVPVGYEIAVALDAPLDVLFVRKIGAPFQPELALGAVVEGDPPDSFIDEAMCAVLEVPRAYVDDEVERQLAEIARRRALYADCRPLLDVAGRAVIVVDDGIATGATMRIAIRALKLRRPGAIILAVPVASTSAVELLRPEVAEIACLAMPADFDAIGRFYADFTQVDDSEVMALLRARKAGWCTRSPQ